MIALMECHDNSTADAFHEGQRVKHHEKGLGTIVIADKHNLRDRPYEVVFDDSKAGTHQYTETAMMQKFTMDSLSKEDFLPTTDPATQLAVGMYQSLVWEPRLPLRLRRQVRRYGTKSGKEDL